MSIKSLLTFIIANLSMLLLSTHVLACNSKDPQRPVLKVSIETNNMLLSRNFTELNKMVEVYRKENVLTSDGQPKLMGFYMGIMHSISECKTEHSEAEWSKFRTLLQDWRSASNDKSAANLSLAMFELAYGWHARGSSYAYKVSEEGWRLLKERNNNAKKMLAKMGAKERKDPQWYVNSIEVAAREDRSSKKYALLYRDAIKKFPQYYEFYFSYASYLSPEWGGSMSDFHEYVNQTVKQSNEKMGRVMYTRLHWSHADDDMFIDRNTDWSRMKLGFETILENFPDAWNRNNFASFACLAGDKKTFIEQFNIIKNNILSDAWRGPYNLSRCKYEFGLTTYIEMK